MSATALFAAIAMATAAHADVAISSQATSNMNCSNGVCAPTATDAVLNTADLETMLASGNVKVTTTGSGVQANNIDVAAKLSWSSTNTLALDSYESIMVDGKVSVKGRSGLSLTTNDGGSGGTLVFGNNGSATFRHLNSQLTINGLSFTLVNTISALAGEVVSDPSGTFALVNDYNASNDGTYQHSPIVTPLTGTVEGLGHAISNLSIANTVGVDIGLFQEIGTRGLVESVNLTKVKIVVGRDHAALGSLSGVNKGTVFDDHATGSINSRQGAVGGLVGENVGTGLILQSSADVKVRTGKSGAGGLVAGNSGTISQSQASGAVKGATVSGGLVGGNEGPISESFATGAVESKNYAGGLVGLNESNGTDAGTVDNSYSTGAVAGYVSGGLIGGDTVSSALENSYSTGAVDPFNNEGGGFGCDVNQEDVANDYWDTTTSGMTVATCNGNFSGITGLTTQQFQSGLPSGFDSSIWAENPSINGGLPYLINNPPKS